MTAAHPLDLPRCRARTQPPLPGAASGHDRPARTERASGRRFRQGAEDSVGTDPLLPGTALPGRPAEQIQHANADNTICQAGGAPVAARLAGLPGHRRGALSGRTRSPRWRRCSTPSAGPQWLDFAHENVPGRSAHRPARRRRGADLRLAVRTPGYGRADDDRRRARPLRHPPLPGHRPRPIRTG